jgi:hypothetical protein
MLSNIVLLMLNYYRDKILDNNESYLDVTEQMLLRCAAFITYCWYIRYLHNEIMLMRN